MSADLHLHTTESDGTWTPQEVVQRARRHHLSIISITDHDTTAGIEAAQRGAPPGLEVIPGIELSTFSATGEDIHILGYWINQKSRELQERLTLLRKARVKRARRILELLARQGIVLRYEDILSFAGREVVSRSHVAAALQKKGIVRSKEEAFFRYIGAGQPAFVPSSKMAPEEAVAVILKAGGVPVLAHPGQISDLSVIPGLVEAGLVGMEVIHPSHGPARTEYFLKLAQKLSILPSGGSDCHGPEGKDQVFMGRFNIPLSWVKALEARRP